MSKTETDDGFDDLRDALNALALAPEDVQREAVRLIAEGIDAIPLPKMET